MDPTFVHEYEQVLCGAKPSISPYYFNEQPAVNERKALELVKYVLEEYLHWTPEYAYSHLTMELVNNLKLASVIKLINLPAACAPDTDVYTVVAKIYPNRIKIDFRKLTLLVYQRILHREAKKFPKMFFSGSDGIARMTLCLRYSMAQSKIFESTRDIYKFFASQEGRKWLRDKRLAPHIPLLFPANSNLAFVHHALHDASSEFWYHYYTFVSAQREQIKSMEAKGTFIA